MMFSTTAQQPPVFHDSACVAALLERYSYKYSLNAAEHCSGGCFECYNNQYKMTTIAALKLAARAARIHASRLDASSDVSSDGSTHVCPYCLIKATHFEIRQLCHAVREGQILKKALSFIYHNVSHFFSDILRGCLR